MPAWRRRRKKKKPVLFTAVFWTRRLVVKMQERSMTPAMQVTT
jgi:hypothetical protein